MRAGLGPNGARPFSTKANSQTRSSSLWGEPVQFPPNVKGVGGPISHGWATFARRVHESGAGAPRVSRLLAFSCCSGPVWGGGGGRQRWPVISSSHAITYGRRPVAARNTGMGSQNFEQFGSAAHPSCPAHVRGVLPTYRTCLPARFSFSKNINGCFRCDSPFTAGKTSFSVEKSAANS